MKIFIINTLTIMEDIVENFKDAVMVILTCIWWFVMLLTMPLWIIPYLIFRKKGKHKRVNTDEQNDR